MRKSITILFFLIVLVTGNYAQQCLTGGCTTGFVSQYPAGIQSNATTSWQLVNGGNNMNAGNYTLFSLTAGTTYQWSYCEGFGGVSTSWDAQLTLFDNSNLNIPLCFSTDVCGTNSNAPHISYTPSTNMTARLLTTSYVSGVGGCQTNSGSPYNKLVWKKTAGATYNLTITVHNTSSALVNNAHVLLYDANWSSLDNDYTNSSGQASFSGLANGTYNYEVYFTPSGTNPPLSPVDEFWGSGTLSINNGNSSVSFTRVQPYISSAPGFSPSSVPAGTTSTGSFTVSNGLSYSINSKVQVFVDLDQSNPWDYNSTSASQSITAGNTKTFAFNVTTPTMGAYKYYAFVYSLVNGSYIITDQYAWTTAFTATCPTLAMPTAPTPGSSVGPGTVLTTLTPSFSWGGTSSGIYHIQIWDAATNPADESNVIYGFHTSINSPGHCISGLSHQLPAGVLVNNGQYKWSVHRNDPCGVCESNPTTPLYFQIVTTCTSPSTPASNSASGVTSASFTANWNTVNGATTYYADVSLNSGFSNLIYNNHNVGSGTSYVFSGLNCNTTYYYRIRANNSCGTSGNSSAITTTTNVCCTAPNPPTASSASGITATSFNANWSASSGASAYYVDVSTSSGFATFVYNNQSVGNVTSYNFSGLNCNATYYYRVRASSSCGTSNSSSSITATTSGCTCVTISQATITSNPSNAIVTAPTSISFTATASGTPPFSYQWQKSIDNGLNWSPVGSNSSAYYTGATVTGMNGYRFRCIITGCNGSSATTNAIIINVSSGSTVTISGFIYNNHLPLSGGSYKSMGNVQIIATGSIDGGEVFTDLNGSYRITVPSGWTGTITPLLDYFDFNPTSQSFNNVTTNSQQNFDAVGNDLINGNTIDVPHTITSPVGTLTTPPVSFPEGLTQSYLPNVWYISNCSNCSLDPSNNPWSMYKVYPAKDCPYQVPYTHTSNLSQVWRYSQRGGCNYTTSCCNANVCNNGQCHRSGHAGATGLSYLNTPTDDNYAWDITLGGSQANKSIYAVADGIVLKKTNIGATTSGDPVFDILIGHPAASPKWYSGYRMVMNSPSSIQENAAITDGTIIGRIFSGNYHGYTPHLHFGVFYKNGTKLYSVNRTIKARPLYVNQIGVTAVASVLSNAKINLKKNNDLIEISNTDETGFTNLTESFEVGDSLLVRASGYKEMYIPLDSGLINMKKLNFVMLKDEGEPLKIKYPKIEVSNPATLYTTPSVQVKLSGENYNFYDVYRLVSDADSFYYELIQWNKPKSDSVLQISLNNIGTNTYTVLFKGQDSVEITKSFTYDTTSSNIITASISCANNFFGTKVYVDNNFYKEIDNTFEQLPLSNGIHSLTFHNWGYRDTTYIIESQAAIALQLSPLPDYYSPVDSSIISFANSEVVYHKNITLLDSNMQALISVRQYVDNFHGNGLIPQSRKFDFCRLNSFSPNILFAAVLDQILLLSKDSIYLLNIGDSAYEKYNLDSISICEYDSSVQKLGFTRLNFNNGADQTQALVIMKRQPPVVVGGGFYLAEDVPLHISYNNFFSDPDSIHGDMTFSLVSADTSLMVQQVGDSLYITPAANFSGNATITLSATHDWLTKTITVAVNVTAVNDAPVISSVGNLSFCSNGAITLNTTPAISDVDNLLSQISESISILSSSNANVSVNSLTYSQIQAHQFSFNSSQAEVSTFTVRIIATDGTDSSNAQIFNITVNMPPDVKAVASDTLLCYGESLTLTGIGATTYAWSNNAQDGVPVFPQSSVQYTVTGTDGNGCMATDEQLVLVFSLPPVTALASNNAVCAGTSITLTGSGAGTYQWSGGVVDAVTFIPVSTLTYTVTGTDGNGCSATDAILVSVNAHPVISILATDTIVCSNDHVTLTGAGAQNYAWSGSISNGIAFVPLQTQTYTLTGTDSNNCSSIATVQIIVNQLPQASISSATSTTFCEGDSVVLTSSAASSYLWSNGETIRSISAKASNQYTVTVTDLNGCTAAAVPIVITVNPLPLVSFSQFSDVLETMPAFAISGGNPPGGTYSGPGVISGSFDPAIAGVGTHVVTYTYTDANGCTEKAQSTITVTKTTSIDNIGEIISLSVFPNPNTGNFTVQLITNTSQKAQITCLTLVGEEVYSQEYQVVSGRLSADLELKTVSKGIYLLCVTIGGKSIYRKLLIAD